MKKLFFVLLLLNVIFFATIKLRGPGWGDQVKQEQPPLHEENIRLLDISKSAPNNEARLSAPARIPVSPVPSPDLQPAMNKSVPAASEPDIPTCLAWGDFSGPDLARATTILSGLQLGDKLNQREIEHDTGYWVYIPPLRNRSAANKKISELRNLGVKEYFVVSSAGRWRNAISLGVFKTQEAAQNFLDQLRTKGVRSAQIGERASKLRAIRFMLNGVNSETKARLIEMQKDFAGSELGNVSCALTRQDEIGRMPRSSR